MTAEKCVVEGCNLEYDVVCSFSFYNVNTQEEGDGERAEWISGAMKEEGECLWRHVSLHLCGYHFELDSQGLWIDSPMLPELLTPQTPASVARDATDEEKRGPAAPATGGYQGLFAQFVGARNQAADVIRTEHNYSTVPPPAEPVSRLNVRQLVDTLGYLSLKNLQRKQLWVVKVETEKGEASITQSEQCIQKMQESKQIIEIIPQSADQSQDSSMEMAEDLPAEDMPVIEEQVTDQFIYEIAEEQEIAMEEVKELPSAPQEWLVNIVPETHKSKYAFIKHCNTGKKKRHFTADMNEITLSQGDFDNYYILPDADPSVGVEVTTSYEEGGYLVGDYQMVLDERPRKRPREPKGTGEGKKRKKKVSTVREQVRQIKTDIGSDWVIENSATYDQDDSDDYDPKNKARSRRKSKKYDYDFVT